MIHEETAQRPAMPCVGPAGKRSNPATTRRGPSWQESWWRCPTRRARPRAPAKSF